MTMDTTVALVIHMDKKAVTSIKPSINLVEGTDFGAEFPTHSGRFGGHGTEDVSHFFGSAPKTRTARRAMRRCRPLYSTAPATIRLASTSAVVLLKYWPHTRSVSTTSSSGRATIGIRLVTAIGLFHRPITGFYRVFTEWMTVRLVDQSFLSFHFNWHWFERVCHDIISFG